MRSPSSSGPGSGTARRPSSRISKMPTSPAGPKRCLTDVSTRRAWWRSPSKESTVSTRCSTARGPARSPSLVTWPTRRSGHAGRLGHAGQALDAGAHLGQAAGGLAQLGIRDGLQRVDHHQGGTVPLDGRLDRLDVGALNGQQVPGHQADARRPAPHLGQRLLGRGQHDVEPGGRQRREHLEEQGRLADAGRPEEQRDRAGDDAAAHDPVELADAGRERAGAVGRDVDQGQRRRALGFAGLRAARGAPVPDRACSTRRRPGSVRPTAARSRRRTRRGMHRRRGRANGEPWPWRHPTGGCHKTGDSCQCIGCDDAECRGGRLDPWRRRHRDHHHPSGPACRRRRHPRRRRGRVLLRRDARRERGARHRPGHLVGATGPPAD